MVARIRSTDTKPEMILRRRLHAAGFRYRLHVAGLPGKPDIVLHKFRSVIFVHICYRPERSDCKNFRSPKTRPEFWNSKNSANRDRADRAMTAIHNAA